jgi:hypothetical protein
MEVNYQQHALTALTSGENPLHFVRPQKSNCRVLDNPPRDNIQEEFTARNKKSKPATHFTKQFHEALGALKVVVCSLAEDSAIRTASTSLPRLMTCV